MDFRTKVEIPDFGFKINHSQSCIFTGSCFAENVGSKLKDAKFKSLVNPTGIHYNPLSVADSVKMALAGIQIKPADLFFENGIWNHFNFHSRFSGLTEKEACSKMNLAIQDFAHELKTASHLFVTFGTSFIYELAETGKTVTNCHKIPANKFNRRFVKTEETIDVWQNLLAQLKAINPRLNIIFTVSPVRHLKDGAISNQQSKAALLLAVKELTENNTNVFYFPAYEILMDELRNYRFYADDMLHPSEMAIKYIWEKFSESFFSSQTTELNKKIEKIVTASRHRVFNQETEEHKKFCATMLTQINDLCKNNPELDFTEEIEVFNLGK